jgi:hypothetical protein
MKRTLLILLLAISVSSVGQTVKLAVGDLKPLKGEKIIKTEFTYDKMVVSEANIPEEDYVKKRKGELNAKEINKGDEFEKNWYGARQTRFEPKFNLLFEKYAKVSTKGDSKYTLIFKTIMTEPGWVAVGLIRSSARIDAEAWIVETANPSVIIAKFTVNNAPGGGAMGYDYDPGFRIQEAYAKSAKELGKLIASKIK